MDIAKILDDKLVKPKEKTEALSKLLLGKNITIKDLIKIAKNAKDPVKATCIEVMEYATKSDPSIANTDCLNFAVESLNEKAPRIKWESAKVIGNIAQCFPDKLDVAVKNLLVNTEHSGTVVRWSAAYALGQILLTKNKHSKKLIPAIEAICKREEKNSIKKIYQAALKKIGS